MLKQRKFLRAMAIAIVFMLLGGSTVVALADPAEPVTPVSHLAVYDARGKLVSNVARVAGPTSVEVTLSVGSTLVGLEVSRTRFVPGGNTFGFNSLLFESSDCSGQAFTEGFAQFVQDNPPGLLAYVLMNGTKLYLIGAEAQSITTNSRLDGEEATCEQVQFSTTEIPVQFMTDLSSAFEPPFTVR